jgi:uncharacterized YccA/Bax inhibitor family protein
VQTTSNPAFRNLPVGAGRGQYGSYAGFNQPQGGLPGQGGPQAPAGPADRPMTVDDVVQKTGASLGVLLITGFLTTMWAQGQVAAGAGTGAIFGAMIGGMLVGLGIALFIIFKKKPSAPLTLSYAAAEGVFLGAITGVFTAQFGSGIALNAIIGTAGVFGAMLVVYKTGAVKVTPKFRKWMMGALGGVIVLMLANLVAGFFTDGGLGLRDGGTLAILFSLVCIGIAAFSFLLDFDMADQMIRDAAPAKYAWFVAFGLTVTLVWLYLEILRLLAYFQE